MKMQTWIQWSPPSTKQGLKQPVRSLANVRKKNKKKKKNWVTAESLDLGPYVWAVDFDLDHVYLLSTVSIEKIGMYDAQLDYLGRPKRVYSYSLIFLRLSGLNAG